MSGILKTRGMTRSVAAPSRVRAAQSAGAAPSAAESAQTLQLARQEVRKLLQQSEAFNKLPPDAQREIANNTVRVSAYLAEPEGMRLDGSQQSASIAAATGLNPKAAPQSPSAASADPYAFALEDASDVNTDKNRELVSSMKPGDFKASAAREGAKVAGVLLKQVNFPTFVSSLVKGVFHAIVESSIEQMEAYGNLVKSVAQTLDQFRDENVSENQGKDHLVSQFPDLFEVGVDNDDSGRPVPKVSLKDGVDEAAAVKRVQSLPVDGAPVSALDDDTIRDRLVPAARTQLATSRQQLLATMVLMGINRIVVTDGRISAKVMYDFQARDNFKFQKSAAFYDYQKNADGTAQLTTAREGTYEKNEEGGSVSHSKDSDDRQDPSYYAKGTYQTSQQPILTASSAATEASDASLSSKASLAGKVDINFKSETFPLEKMADSFQIGMIQNAAKPATGGGRGGGTGTAAASGGTPGAASGGGTTGPAPAASK